MPTSLQDLIASMKIDLANWECAVAVADADGCEELAARIRQWIAEGKKIIAVQGAQ